MWHQERKLTAINKHSPKFHDGANVKVSNGELKGQYVHERKTLFGTMNSCIHGICTAMHSSNVSSQRAVRQIIRAFHWQPPSSSLRSRLLWLDIRKYPSVYINK
jgi:hypothetical protein